jgi:hypothetical protein
MIQNNPQGFVVKSLEGKTINPISLVRLWVSTQWNAGVIIEYVRLINLLYIIRQ